MVAALMAGMLATATVTAWSAPASASSGVAAASAGTAAVRNIPGCVEEQRATWTNGSPAPWEACNSRSGIQGIEGSNAVNSRGTIFQAAAVLDNNGQAGLARSRDGGKTWQRVPLPSVFWDIIGFVQVDKTTNRLFYSSFDRSYPNGTDPIGYSDDDGNTWHVTQIGGTAADPGTQGDLGTIFVGPPPKGTKTSGYPNVVYYCNFAPIPSFGPNVQCWRSLDGGKTFQLPSSQPTFSKNDCAPVNGPGAPITYADLAIPSEGTVAPNGTVYLPMSECGQYVVGTSKDAGKTFTWTPVPNALDAYNQNILADEEQNYPGCAGSVAFAGCPELFQGYGEQRLAVDAKGTLYFIFNNHQLMLSMSRDGGKSWTEPAPMSVPGVQAVFSAVVARGNGEVGLSYLGQSAGSNDWNGYMAVVEHADNPRARTIATALVNAPGDPLMPYRCCGSKVLITPPGSPEGTSYNLIEYNGLSFAPDGTLWSAFFRDSTRDPSNTQSAAYEIVAGHMAPIWG
jgi:photosystem II stability/assembly factor-like uncharacterized protein